MKSKQVTSQPSSDRDKWQKVFDALVGIVRKQQSQLQTLVTERKLLEDRIRTQQKLYESDVSLLRDRIAQMKGDLAVQDMTRSLDARKLELAVGLKQRQILLQKLKLDETETMLFEFKECLDNIAAELPGPKQDSQGNHPEARRSKRLCRESGQRSPNESPLHNPPLEDEIKRLKQELDKVVSEKNAQVSALLTEKKFVWNQYKILETNLDDKLKTKEAEAHQANKKVSELLSSMERLQSSNNDKDQAIAKLKSKIIDVEDLAKKRGDEIVRLTQELELFRRSRSGPETPALSQCTTSRGSAASSRNNKRSEGGSRGFKRKADDIDSSQNTPKLFSPAFKVPKLKTPSEQRR